MTTESRADYGNGNSAIVYCQGHFGGMDGKTANGLVRHSSKYQVVAVIDSDKEQRDAGQVLDGKANGIPICRDLDSALRDLKHTPEYFIFGLAPLGGVYSGHQRQILFKAMECGMHIVNGLHEYLNENREFASKAKACGVNIIDVRKPQRIKDLSVFSGDIDKVKCPVVAVLGTDSAIGKRTTATILVQALQARGIKAVMVATGQTGLIQGAKYGVALDSLPEQFISGEMEKAVVSAYLGENPDLIIIEGQGSLGHPAYLSSCFIIRGSRPDAVIMQHAPKRTMLGDYPKIPMPNLEDEIKLVEVFSGSKVIAVTINHENMSPRDVIETTGQLESQFGLPTTDVLMNGPEKLIGAIELTYPHLLQISGYLGRGVRVQRINTVAPVESRLGNPAHSGCRLAGSLGCRGGCSDGDAPFGH